MFVEEYKRNKKFWIMKPVGKAQGRGIFLFDNLKQIADWKSDASYNLNFSERNKEIDERERRRKTGKGDYLTYINDAVYKSSLMIPDFHTATPTFLAIFMTKSIQRF